MPSFPLFVDLKGKKCIVVGGGKVASRKIEMLDRFNGDIVVISPEITYSINTLKESGKLTHISRFYKPSDIKDAFMIIAATSDESVNELIYNDAVNHGVLVNVVDDPKRCTFFFPSLVKRGDLVIGISTSGGYPALSKHIRKKLDNIIDDNINEEVISYLKEFRKKVILEIQNAELKASILNNIIEETIFTDSRPDIESLKAKMDAIYKKYTEE
ncbi:MAG TPA: bifunctional precorrin-2 dehydrogenase/sirohydrochlorin ferrochelatase [Pseudobacteroides sp.]|uniref:precorrin-2 dehydrogenase/sirohydrochlorin ferrochelatase family protein n=1 Tax=Pseudobacteroides sp. TaxID=1968840 RepID=UPI002F939C93